MSKDTVGSTSAERTENTISQLFADAAADRWVEANSDSNFKRSVDTV
jgi:hypothetical protein